MTPADLADFLRRHFPLVNDHPDVAGLFRSREILAALGPALAAPFTGSGITLVLAPEARGPVLGALVARELGCGLMLARKDGRNHPGADVETSGGPGWSGSTEVFQTRSFDLDAEDGVLIVDDWVTTGSSLRALRDVVDAAGATIVGVSVIVDKTTPDTRDQLGIRALVRFDEIAGVPHRDR